MCCLYIPYPKPCKKVPPVKARKVLEVVHLMKQLLTHRKGRDIGDYNTRKAKEQDTCVISGEVLKLAHLLKQPRIAASTICPRLTTTNHLVHTKKSWENTKSLAWLHYT